jgi:hypothetical protein
MERADSRTFPLAAPSLLVSAEVRLRQKRLAAFTFVMENAAFVTWMQHRSTTQPVRYWKELKEVLTTHGHRNSPVHHLEFPSFHEADTQSLF